MFKKQRRRISSASSPKLSFEVLESRQLLAGLDGSEVFGLPSDMVSSAYVFIGDHSPSNSEKWNMAVGDRTHSAPDFGEVQRDYRDFKKGLSYPVTVQHAGSIYPTGEEDFDYRAWVDRYANPTWTSGSPVPIGTEFFVNDPQQLFQRQYWANTGATDPTIGKSATVHFPGIDLDIDSLDDSGFSVPIDNIAEDQRETDNQFGKRINTSRGDIDGDNVIDVYDFDGIQGKRFVPLLLSLSSNILAAAPSSIQLSFTYGDSNPLDFASTGLMRIWTKDASSVRSPGSDFISSSSFFDASRFGLYPGGNALFFVEAVNATSRVSLFDKISVTVSVVGNYWSGTLVDEVHVRTEEPDVKSVVFVPTTELDLTGISDSSHYGQLDKATNPNGKDEDGNKYRGQLIQPQYEGGDRFFPDADAANVALGRNIVRVRAELQNVDEGDLILFRAFDVDDPSRTASIDPNGAKGGDNRGRLDELHSPSNSATISTTSNGFHGKLRSVNSPDNIGQWEQEGVVVKAKVKKIDDKLVAEVDLLTSFAPGDNFRVVAVPASKKDFIEQAHVNSSGNYRIVTNSVNKYLTPQLAAWRYLNIEDDILTPIDNLFSLLQPTTNRQENRLSDLYIQPRYDAVGAIDTSNPPQGGQLVLNNDNSISVPQITAIDEHRQSKTLDSDLFWATYVTDSLTTPSVAPGQFIGGVTQIGDRAKYEISVVHLADTAQYYAANGANAQAVLEAQQKTVVHEIGHQLFRSASHSGDQQDITRYWQATNVEKAKISRWQDDVNIMNAAAVQVPMNNPSAIAYVGDFDYFYFSWKDINRLRLKRYV